MRYAIRSVFKHPGFSAIAIGTLAVGIALNVALFGIFNAMLFRPLPVADPGRLLGMMSASTEPDGPRGNLTYPDFEALRARRDVLSDAFAYARVQVGVRVGGHAVRAHGQIVTTNMFDLLGVEPVYGRAFAATENREPVAVLSFNTWQRTLGADPAAVGRAVTLNGRPFTIIGVAPEGFIGPDLSEPAELWIPLGMHAVALPGSTDPLSHGHWWLTGIGRLAPGVGVGQARAVLSGVAEGIALSAPATHTGFTVRTVRYHGSPDDTRGQIAPIAALVMGVTLCVLLIACANVAGLLLSRAASRQREISIRLAIGATRGALARLFLSESLVLAAAAGIVGLIAAMWGTEAIVRLAGVPAIVDSTPDWRVMLFTMAVSLMAGVAFGLTPALRAAGLPLVPSLRSEPGSDARPQTSRLQRGLIIGQLALSLVMLASAGILIRGLAAAWRTDVGFAYDNRVAISTDLRLQHYDPQGASAFFVRAITGIRALPGVEGATLAHLVPFGGRVFVHGLAFPGKPADAHARPERVSVNRVWTDFFSTLRIPITRGRDFSEADLRPGSGAAIVSETMARRYWPDLEPIGQRFSIDGAKGPFHTIIGVARDVRIDEFTERPWPAAWLPHAGESGEVVVLASSTRPKGQVIREIEGVIRGIDRDLPIFASRPLRDYVAERLDGERALLRLLAVCGVLALALACLGLYGVTAYAVTLRTREMGVRMALGAGASDVRRLFVRESLQLAARGLMWGLLPAVAATYALSGMLVGVFPVDPVTLIGSGLVLAAATTLAAYLPARRATRVDPLVALRAE
ncbi:MAG TPA: ABC transporter permease [Vicinamibacterales bacterium]|nr:ABC transporter permease [Vicinamibacterales bacterium]